jgi:FkbM family methyltransferase
MEKNTGTVTAPWEVDFVRVASEQDVFHCFRLFLGRCPTKHEWPAHNGAFVGKPLDAVVSVYLNSPEFKARKVVAYSLDDVEFVQLDGYGMFVSKNDLVIGIHIRSRHEYEPQVSEVFREILRPGMRVIDVGANVGWFSCLSCHLVGPGGRVVAVEAGEVNTKLLMMSRLKNAWDHLSIMSLAASDRVETLLYSSNSSNGFVRVPVDVDEIAGGDPVGAVPLGPVLEDGRPWHLIKIDVEGYEFKVLEGLDDMIRRHKPVMLIEFAPPSLRNTSGVDGKQFLGWLIERGYSVTILTTTGRHDCGADIERVLAHYESAESDHVDLLLRAGK